MWFAGLMMRLQGTSAWDVTMRKELFTMIRNGGENTANNNVTSITGHEARSFEQFVEDHLHRFS